MMKPDIRLHLFFATQNANALILLQLIRDMTFEEIKAPYHAPESARSDVTVGWHPADTA